MDWLYTVSGFLVGLIVGVTGVGGGSLMTPLLVLFFGVSPATAVGTDLLYASITKALGGWVHGRNGTVDWKIVGLLSIGEEDSKGSKKTKGAFQLLEKSHLNFIGNVESHDLFEGKVDVAVCDGFVGNVVLKTGESVSHAMGQWIKESFSSSLIRKIGAGILKASGAFKEIKEKVDPEAYGGAPLLGVKGVCIIGHGSSSSFAVYNAIRVARTAIEQKLNHLIEEKINEVFKDSE